MTTGTRRRALLCVGAVITAGFVAGRELPPPARAADEPDEVLLDPFPPPPESLASFADRPDFAALELDVELLGTARPTSAEVDMARKVLAASPVGVKPIEVARYFQRVGRGELNGEFGADVRSYVRGWPIRYNPVIINFFRATRTDPLGLQGDFTAWCAAFVNWCIARALSTDAVIEVDEKGIMRPFAAGLLAKGTTSASSGSFRCWPDAQGSTDDPKVGDLIVWAIEGSVDGCKHGKGHVGFFAGRDADGRYRTLGGNQRDPNTRHYAVVEKGYGASFTRDDGKAVLHSLRTADLL